MKAFKKIYFSSLALLICFSFLGVQTVEAQEVKSDYKIQKEFKNELQSINQSLDTAESTSRADTIVNRIKSLERDYSGNEQLLNKALYPETFQQRMKDLKMRAVSVQQRLAVIEKQNNKLNDLNEQVTDYDSRLTQLNSRTDSLRSAMQQSVQSEKALSGQLREYRQNLEQRDDLILSIIDSVMIAYKNLDIDSMTNAENTTSKARMSANGNPLNLVRSIADENLQLLNSNPQLTTADYLRMNSVQNEFSIMWERVGDKLARIYSENPGEVSSEVERSIESWGEKVNSGLWTSINEKFEEEGVNLQEFNDSGTFASALNNYVDDGLNESKENGSEEARENYRNFSDFWNKTVKRSWGQFLTEGDVLSTQQMATVDEKLDQWSGFTQPESNTFVYLFGLSILAIVVLGVMLFRERSAHNHPHA